jgi:hypothetical protein
VASVIEPIIIRASAVSSYNDCPRRGASKIFRKQVIAAGFQIRESRRGIAAAIGTGSHSGAMSGARRKSQGETTNTPDLVEIGIVSLREEIAEGVEYDDTTRSPNGAEIKVRSIVTIYASELLLVIEPMTVECKLEATLSDGVLVTGHPDLIETNDTIRDLKTGKSGVGHYAQMGTYSLLRQANHHPRPGNLLIDHIPQKTPALTRHEYPVDVCEQTARSTIREIIRQYRLFESNQSPEVFPANPISMLCSEKYCTCYNSEFCRIKQGGV